MQTLPRNELIVIDTETTGIDHKRKIIQLSIIDGNGNVLFNELMKPRYCKKWDDAQRIHGIAPKDVEHKPTITKYKKRIQSILDQYKYVVGYNVNFDLVSLNIEGFDTSKFMDYETLLCRGLVKTEPTIIDLMPIFSKMYNEIHAYYKTPKWQKLTTAAAFYNYDWKQYGAPHGAIADAHATLYLYNMMVEHGTDIYNDIPNHFIELLNNTMQQYGAANQNWFEMAKLTIRQYTNQNWKIYQITYNEKGITKHYFDESHQQIQIYKSLIESLYNERETMPFGVLLVYQRLVYLYNDVVHPRYKNKWNYRKP